MEPDRADALVVGAGRFGSRALHALGTLHPPWRILVLDRSSDALQLWKAKGMEVHQGDAVPGLDRIMRRRAPRWIVPAVPLHLAFEWIMYRLSSECRISRIPAPEGLAVPNPLIGDSGDLYCSFATFICPEDCPEPRGTCTVTGERRPRALFDLLKNLSVPQHRVLGLRSHQLAPGVGGYRGEALLRLLASVRAKTGDSILFTACRCHGVISGLRIQPA